MFTIGSLFAGIGGFDYAFTSAGFDVLWQVEKDAFCQQVLAKHFPSAVRHADVFDCHDLPYVDVICAGFPCQPFSQAGQQRGQDDERYLIPEMLRIIDESQPTVFLLENVKGFTSLNDGAEFRLLLRQIADMGYDAQWGHLRASDIGAPHRRERWFLVAYRHQQRRAERGQDSQYPRERFIGAGHVSNATSARWKEWEPLGRWAHTTQTKAGMESKLKRCGHVGNANSQSNKGYGWQGQFISKTSHEKETIARSSIRHSGQQLSAIRRLDRDAHGLPEKLDGHIFPAYRNQDQKENEPPRTVDPRHSPNRKARLKALGNAVVPQVVYPLALSIREYLEGNIL